MRIRHRAPLFALAILLFLPSAAQLAHHLLGGTAQTVAAYSAPPQPGSTYIMLGESMAPTVRDHQVLTLQKDAYRRHGPRRGDLVVFRAVPAGQPNRYFLKRVIGLPGEAVAVRNGAVYINYHRLHEPYVRNPAAYVYRQVRIPRGSYFVLGDNRNNSEDSHLWGSLAARYIIGRAVPRH